MSYLKMEGGVKGNCERSPARDGFDWSAVPTGPVLVQSGSSGEDTSGAGQRSTWTCVEDEKDFLYGSSVVPKADIMVRNREKEEERG